MSILEKDRLMYIRITELNTYWEAVDILLGSISRNPNNQLHYVGFLGRQQDIAHNIIDY